ncbi:hypothetical protein PM082_024913 [Marasmius tenuissimus]|nr:hypothetical protein PM082_024913 [Marasmius tenuissimus]
MTVMVVGQEQNHNALRLRNLKTNTGNLDDSTVARPLFPPSSRPPAVKPFTSPMAESHTSFSIRTSTPTMTDTRTTTPLSGSVPKSTSLSQKPHQLIPRRNQTQAPHTETEPELLDENISVNKSEFSAMRAEMSAMKTRLAVLEAEVADQPPDYVSSYTSTSGAA